MNPNQIQEVSNQNFNNNIYKNHAQYFYGAQVVQTQIQELESEKSQQNYYIKDLLSCCTRPQTQEQKFTKQGLIFKQLRPFLRQNKSQSDLSCASNPQRIQYRINQSQDCVSESKLSSICPSRFKYSYKHEFDHQKIIFDFSEKIHQEDTDFDQFFKENDDMMSYQNSGQISRSENHRQSFLQVEQVATNLSKKNSESFKQSSDSPSSQIEVAKIIYSEEFGFQIKTSLDQNKETNLNFSNLLGQFSKVLESLQIKPEEVVKKPKQNIQTRQNAVGKNKLAKLPPVKKTIKKVEKVQKKQQKKQKVTKITNCLHTSEKHYAKGMCNFCYHTFGRQNKASQCPHKDQPNYAKKLCKHCYFSFYNKNQRARN